MCTLKRVSAENGSHVHLPQRLSAIPRPTLLSYREKQWTVASQTEKHERAREPRPAELNLLTPIIQAAQKKIFAGGQVSSTHWLGGLVRSIVPEEGSFNTGAGGTMGVREASASEQK